MPSTACLLATVSVYKDCVFFFRHNGVYLSMEDCDAILRRFDHNGNTRIEFDEFYELVTGFEVEKSNEIPEKETKFTELKPVDDRKSS